MKDMTLSRIATVCGGTYYGDESKKNEEIAGAVIDSRQVEQGYLFIPIKGERVDGHTFIPQVFSKGALAVLSEHTLENPAGPYILVDSCAMAMQKIAAAYRRALDVKVVGITGSVGKTSTKEMIASVLSQKYNVLKTEGNFNNEIGLPLTIFKIREEHEVAVLEMGISHFDEMHRLAEMAQPDIMVITNIGLCHLENLITRDGILKAKTESFEHLAEDGMVILNGDDDKLATVSEVNGRKPVFYGIGAVSDGSMEHGSIGNKREIFAENVRTVGMESTECTVHLGKEVFSVTLPLAGVHNVYNALAAAAVARELGLTVEEMKRGMETVKTIGGRSNLIEKDGMTIIDDCYNANPVSMQASIEVLSHAAGRKIAVLGDMGELGTEEKQLHYKVGAYFKGKKIDALFASGALSAETVRGVKENSPATEVFYYEDKEALAQALKDYCKEGDTILVKASHFMNYPEIVKALLS